MICSTIVFDVREHKGDTIVVPSCPGGCEIALVEDYYNDITLYNAYDDYKKLEKPLDITNLVSEHLNNVSPCFSTRIDTSFCYKRKCKDTMCTRWLTVTYVSRSVDTHSKRCSRYEPHQIELSIECPFTSSNGVFYTLVYTYNKGTRTWELLVEFSLYNQMLVKLGTLNIRIIS